MLALEILSMKNFMAHLLTGDTFDGFLLEEATISTANTYSIDGHLNADFFPAEERDREHLPYDFRPWSELKTMCFDLIKGKHTPLYFKFVLQLKPEKMQAILTRDGSIAGKAASGASSGISSGVPSPVENISLSGDLAKVKAFVLNIRYDGSKAILTTGTSCHTFVLSKEADLIWDRALSNYLNDKGIGYEKL